MGIGPTSSSSIVRSSRKSAYRQSRSLRLLSANFHRPPDLVIFSEETYPRHLRHFSFRCPSWLWSSSLLDNLSSQIKIQVASGVPQSHCKFGAKSRNTTPAANRITCAQSFNNLGPRFSCGVETTIPVLGWHHGRALLLLQINRYSRLYQNL
jgi:hypothetical protein